VKYNPGNVVFLLLSLLFLSCATNRPADTGTLSFISIDEELTLGEDISSFTLRYLDIIRNRSLDKILNDMAEKIGAVSHWSGLPYRVFVINNDGINHFSLPGGNIYLFRGLIENADTADEIAVILAHEIAHLAERDAVARLAEKYSFSFAAQTAIGENPEIAEYIIASLYTDATILDYPKTCEFRADKLALEYARMAGFNPRYLSIFLAKIQELESKEPHRCRLLYMTHPPASARLKRVKRLLKKQSIETNYALNFAIEFQNAKRILSRIPQK